jgi:hypothetical protein
LKRYGECTAKIQTLIGMCIEYPCTEITDSPTVFR